MRICVATILMFSSMWSVAAPIVGAGSCEVRSGPRTAALIELYTSEGCSSCPPADQALGKLRELLGANAEGFGLALHVDYWDYIGWRDPWAQEIFSERHRRLVSANHHDVVYTPHFFVNGIEMPPGQSALHDEVRELNAQRAQAQIQLSAGSTSAGTVTLDVSAQSDPNIGSPALYIVVSENGLVSNVRRGENAGRTLRHEHVARTWIGPIALHNGAITVHRELPLPDRGSGARWELTAFVEDERTGKVVQALGLQPCTTF